MNKYCRYCYEPLSQRPDEPKANWEKRTYCDKVCAAYHIAEKRKRRK